MPIVRFLRSLKFVSEKSKLLIVHGRAVNKVLTEELVEIAEYIRLWSTFVDVYLTSESPMYYTNGNVFAQEYGKPIFSLLFKRQADSGVEYSYLLDHNMFFNSTDAAVRYGLERISGRMGMGSLGAAIQPIVKSLKLNATIEGKEREPRYLDSPFTYLKSGSLSFIGTDLCKYCSVPCPESRLGFWLFNWEIQSTNMKIIDEVKPATGPRFRLKTVFGIESYDQYMPSEQIFPVENNLYFIPPFWIVLLNIPYWYFLSCLIFFYLQR